MKQMHKYFKIAPDDIHLFEIWYTWKISLQSIFNFSNISMKNNIREHKAVSQKHLHIYTIISNVIVAWLGVKKLFIPLEFLCIQKIVYIISCPHYMNFFFNNKRITTNVWIMCGLYASFLIFSSLMVCCRYSMFLFQV